MTSTLGGFQLHLADPGPPHPLKLSLAWTVPLPLRIRIQRRSEDDTQVSDLITGDPRFDRDFLVITPDPGEARRLLDTGTRRMLLTRVFDRSLFLDEQGAHVFVHREDRGEAQIEREKALAARELIEVVGSFEAELAPRHLRRAQPATPDYSFVPPPRTEENLPEPLAMLDEERPFRAHLSHAHRRRKLWLHLELRQQRARGWWRAGVSAVVKRLDATCITTLPELDRDFPVLSERKMRKTLALVQAHLLATGGDWG